MVKGLIRRLGKLVAETEFQPQPPIPIWLMGSQGPDGGGGIYGPAPFLQRTGRGQRLCGAIGPPEVGGAQGLLLPPHIATRACILPVFVTMWRVLNKMPAPGSAGPATKYTLNKRPTDT